MDPDPDPGGPKTCGSGFGFLTRATELAPNQAPDPGGPKYIRILRIQLRNFG
jgi:hypothetical protein